MTTKDNKEAVVPSRPGALMPTTMEQAMILCETLAKSDMVPTEFRGKPSNVFVAIQLGADLGLSPMQALQSIAVFNGRPTLFGDVGLALAFNSGLLEDFEEWYDEDTKTAHCRAKRVGGKSVERTFSQDDADRIVVYQAKAGGGGDWVKLSSRPTHRSYPKRMQQMRARWWALRDTVPDVFKGVAGREELEEHGEEIGREPKDMGLAMRVEEAVNPFMPREAGVPAVQEAAVVTEAAPPVAVVETQRVEAAPIQSAMSFELNGQRFATAGATKDQMLTLFKLCPQVDRKTERGYAKKMLVEEFKVATRSDLTSEQAEQYAIRLREILEG